MGERGEREREESGLTADSARALREGRGEKVLLAGEREREESGLTADSARALREGRGEKVLLADDSGRGGTVHDNLGYGVWEYGFRV
jgi:hypothetical protein